MDQYFTFAEFITCNNLLDFQKTKKFVLPFKIPPTDKYRYDSIEIYRYIGKYMECSNVDRDVTLGNSKLIYTAKQQFIGNDYNGQTIVETTFPTRSTSTLNVNITSLSSFTDNFNTLSNTSINIKTAHPYTVFTTDPGAGNNFTVINDIGFTRRTIYYIIRTYIKGVQDAAPYLLIPDTAYGQFSNHSTKTQVRHDYLHYEGDEIWWSDVRAAGAAGGIIRSGPNESDPLIQGDGNDGISRTCVDINRIYRDAIQAGPTGRGGYAWVSCRSTGRVFKHNLADGAMVQRYNTGVAGRGHGMSIDNETGDAIVGPGDGPVYYFRCTSNGTTVSLGSDTYGGRCAYGILPVFGKPDRMVATTYQNRARLIYPTQNSINILYTAGDLAGYAAASCPNGQVIQARYGGSDYNKINIIDTNVTSGTVGTNVLLMTVGGIEGIASRVSVDLHNLYPHNILNPSFNREYFSIMFGEEYGIRMSGSNINDTPTFTYAAQLNESGTPGFDGENNCWRIAGGSITGDRAHTKTKIYRTAGYRGESSTVNEISAFPFGGYSRYPTASLREWPLSISNTPEIEWFLTRNHEVKLGNPQSSTTLKVHNWNQFNVNEDTLDDTIECSDPANYFYNKTAKEGWESMIDNRRLRYMRSLGGISLSNGSGADYGAGKFFGVYSKTDDDTPGVVYPNSKKWGIRINVADIFNNQTIVPLSIRNDLYNGNLDNFYENGRYWWLPVIKARIRDWSEAFADTQTAYTDILDSTYRLELINKNSKGILVHPYWHWASPAASDRYINTSAGYYDTPLKQERINRYIDNIKKITFNNYAAGGRVYMYSDFTGNVLAGTIEVSPLNNDIIHPEPTDPNMLFKIVSAQQTPTGYVDTPEYCYPWKNIIYRTGNNSDTNTGDEPTPEHPPLVVDNNTYFYFFVDNSGSTNDTYPIIQEILSGPLQDSLIAFYDNDVNLYNDRVKLYSSKSERFWAWHTLERANADYPDLQDTNPDSTTIPDGIYRNILGQTVTPNTNATYDPNLVISRPPINSSKIVVITISDENSENGERRYHFRTKAADNSDIDKSGFCFNGLPAKYNGDWNINAGSIPRRFRGNSGDDNWTQTGGDGEFKTCAHGEDILALRSFLDSIRTTGYSDYFRAGHIALLADASVDGTPDQLSRYIEFVTGKRALSYGTTFSITNDSNGVIRMTDPNTYRNNQYITFDATTPGNDRNYSLVGYEEFFKFVLREPKLQNNPNPTQKAQYKDQLTNTIKNLINDLGYNIP